MRKEEIKQELINRCKFLAKYTPNIVAPYVDEKLIGTRKYVSADIPVELARKLESFLLSDIPYKKSVLYNEFMNEKDNIEYQAKVDRGLKLIDKVEPDLLGRNNFSDPFFIYKTVREFVKTQSGEELNKHRKIIALDEYFRINRYSNDGKKWTSGYFINAHDHDNFNKSVLYILLNSEYDREPEYLRDKKDVGVKKNPFLDYVTRCSHKEYEDPNYSLLTEKEKQEIYLVNHDELPWDLETTCELENEPIELPIDSRYKRPASSTPCGKKFYINTKEMFVDIETLNKVKARYGIVINPDDCSYYQVCPKCGYIVNIKNDLLTSSIKKSIFDRCKQDPEVFRRMELYSELSSLDKTSSNDEKKALRLRLIKNQNNNQ